MTRETAIDIVLLHAVELTRAVGGMHGGVALEALHALGVTSAELSAGAERATLEIDRRWVES